MIKKTALALFLVSSIYYLLLPTPGFPPPPPGSYISQEPADTESVYRKAFYTNFSRDQLIDYYTGLFDQPFIRLNHPPEFSFEYIRDQTKSSWLEELVHIGKDSLYINGFYPTKPTEQINLNGVHYEAKITLRYIPSSPIPRLTVLGLASVALFWLAKEYAHV